MNAEIRDKVKLLYKSTETLVTLLELYNRKIRQQDLLGLKEFTTTAIRRQKISVGEQLRQIQEFANQIETADFELQKDIDALQVLAEEQLCAVDQTMSNKDARVFMDETLKKFNTIRERLLTKMKETEYDFIDEQKILNEFKRTRNNNAHEIEKDIEPNP